MCNLVCKWTPMSTEDAHKDQDQDTWHRLAVFPHSAESEKGIYFTQAWCWWWRGRGCGAVDRIWSKRLSIITSFSSPATRPPAAGHPPWRHYTPFSLGQHSLIWCRGQARDWTFYVNSIQLPALSSKLIFNDFYICPWSEGSRDLPQFFHFLR